MSNDLRKDIKVDAVYDIETFRWDSFVVGGIFYKDGTYDEFRDDCAGDKHHALCGETRMVDALLGINGTIWAHFGGGFDHKWLLDHVAKRDIKDVKIAAAGSRIIFAKVGKLTLADSFAVAPIPLAEFTAGLGVSKQKLGLPCRKLSWCGEECQGFCNIARDAPAEVMARICDYLRADCASLFSALDALRKFSDINGIDLKKTVGASAWSHAARTLKLPSATLNANEHAFARDTYYGGRVQVLRRGFIAEGYEYDVRSMYPWALNANALPVGEHVKLYGRDATAEYYDGAPGCFNVTVEVPYSFVPPLPMRTAKRIYYPHGVFRGHFTRPELDYAVAHCGVEIRAIHESLTWASSKVLFADWTRKIFDIRHAIPGMVINGKDVVGADTPLGIFMKFYANSLTGKLGMNPERYTYCINPSRIKTCVTPEVCGEDCDGDCGSMAQLSEHVWRTKTYALSDCMHVEWAAYLTSHARIKLHKQLVSSGEDDAIYCDTDSVLCSLPRTLDIGPEMGQFEFKRIFRQATFHAPKVYEFVDNGKHKVKAKGLPKGIKVLEPGKSYKTEGIIGFGVGAKEGRLFARRNSERRFVARLGDRKVCADGVSTEPMSVAEALQDSKSRK